MVWATRDVQHDGKFDTIGTIVTRGIAGLCFINVIININMELHRNYKINIYFTLYNIYIYIYPPTRRRVGF